MTPHHHETHGPPSYEWLGQGHQALPLTRRSCLARHGPPPALLLLPPRTSAVETASFSGDTVAVLDKQDCDHPDDGDPIIPDESDEVVVGACEDAVIRHLNECFCGDLPQQAARDNPAGQLQVDPARPVPLPP